MLRFLYFVRLSRWFLVFALMILPWTPAGASEARFDFVDETLRVVGAAPAGESVTVHRALQGNRIVYDSAGNYYPDEEAVRFFALDYGVKQAGDLSVRFAPGPAARGEAARIGFMPAPEVESWALGPDWDMRFWLRQENVAGEVLGAIRLVDEAGRTARGDAAARVPDGEWHAVRVSLAPFAAEADFDWARVVACETDHGVEPGARLWFDDVRFERPATGEVLGVTDKSITQRRAEAAKTRAARVTTAFREAAPYTPAQLRADGRHVYWRDLLNPLFARLWLGEDLPATNAELRRIFTSTDPSVRAEYEIDGHWSLYLSPTLIQLYYTFGHKATRLPGRLEPATEAALLELLWKRTKIKNDIAIARQSPWWMAGSENHDINAKVVNLLSSQIFMQEPAYADRVYPDLGQGSGYSYGKTGLEPPQGGGRARLKDGGTYRARDHYVAWVAFWEDWFLERARRGLFIEVNSPTYELYSLGFLQSLRDLCEDAHLRGQATKFFDLVWADWAQDQIGGMRGGARTRDYGPKSGYGAMTQFSKFLLGGPGNAWHGFFPLLLSDYELPPLIWELALDREGLGGFAYLSRRPGEEEDVWPRPLGNERTLLCDTESRLLRYSWVTPDYVLGTQMDHPAAVHSHLSIDRRTQAMIFAGAPDCLVKPGPLYSGTAARLIGDSTFDAAAPETWRLGTDHMYRSVQNRNVLITQQARTLRRVSPEWFPNYEVLGKPYGILFRGDFDQKMEQGGWIFVAKGNAYLAVRVVVAADEHAGDAFSTSQAKKRDVTPLGEHGYEWNPDRTIARLKNKHSPIVFEAGRRADYPTLADFQREILARPIALHPTVIAPNLGFDILSYTGGGEPAAPLLFNTASDEIPTVAGRYVDYAPSALYDSPYLSSIYGSGVIHVHRGDRRLVLNFNH